MNDVIELVGDFDVKFRGKVLTDRNTCWYKPDFRVPNTVLQGIMQNILVQSNVCFVEMEDSTWILFVDGDDEVFDKYNVVLKEV